MTILILAKDGSQGHPLAARLKQDSPGCLCLVMPPEELDAALQEVQVDCVVCSREMVSPSRKTHSPFVPWPEGAVTDAWVLDLLKAASCRSPRFSLD